MRWLLDIAYLVAGLVYLPVCLYGMVVKGKHRRGWTERFGWVRPRPPAPQRVWIHGVSLGEVNATTGLAKGLRDGRPEVDVVFSATTDTGFARAAELYGADRVFRFPLDLSLVVSRVLRQVHPSLIILMELEVWPNLMRLAEQRGIPVVIANGRLTEHSARRLRRLGPLARSMFRGLTWVGAQDKVIAERFRGLGVVRERIEVASSLKWDTALIADSIPGEEALSQALCLNGSRPVWVCGSTGPGEEAMVLDAYRRLRDTVSPVLVIVPRKPERFTEVARLVEGAGFQCVRRSIRPDGSTGLPLSGSEVILGDTMGELRKFYSLADVVFAGRSLVPMGGSDSMEVAALGKPIITGPHNDNFAESVEQFRSVSGLRLVDSAATLARAVEELLGDPESARAMGGRAREVVRRCQGATDRTLAVVLRLLDAGGGGQGHRQTR